MIIELYKLSQTEYYRISANEVARRAPRRYTTRIRAKLRRAQIARTKSIQQGYEHNNNLLNKKLHPVAQINADCTEIIWHPVVHRWLALAGAEEHDTITPTFTPEW